VEKRNSIRQLWLQVDGGKGNICARFVVCSQSHGGRPDVFQTPLQTENATTGDLLFLPCQEGYSKGLLTKKVSAAMKAYSQAAFTGDVCLNRSLFMKVDDDTFVVGSRFRQGLVLATSMYGDHIFGGVDLPSQPPNRDPSSHWYEPLDVWPQQIYPPAMYGGPGYIMGRSIVQGIIDDGIADKYVLWNEDRAVGVWVNELQKRGTVVNWVRVPGTNGFDWDKPTKGGTWGAYPYVVHHHLSVKCIICLTNLDKINVATMSTDPCFQLEPLPGQLQVGSLR
jgi:hypothetical protein